MKGKNDMSIKRKIGALGILGIFLAIALAMPVASDPTDSDWQRSGTNTYLGNPGDRVGINDDTPDFKLEVTGSSGSGYFGVTSASSLDFILSGI